MKLAYYAKKNPGKAAIIEESGKSLSYFELERKSAQLANLLAEKGLKRGDNIAILLKNSIDYFVVAWAAQRSGLYFTPVNWHLTVEEIVYIVTDCGAKALFADQSLGNAANKLKGSSSHLAHFYCCNGQLQGFSELHSAIKEMPTIPEGSEPAGNMMLYSSGTTGVPKGIKRPLRDTDYSAVLGLEPLMSNLWGFDENSVYLSPAPLYHAAPLGWCMSTQKLGGTTVIMESFDSERYLALIDKYTISHTQCVPTMFSRLLNLPEQVRRQYKCASLEFVVHAAAPCPVEIKDAMLDWWGPIIHEFYSGSEGFGLCAIDAATWLEHKGSVGKPLLGKLHIVDENNQELPANKIGTIYFENPEINFQYHKDPEKTLDCQLNGNWATFGDMGYLDEEGYLYLVDRRTDLILSGGVNIYPSEVECALRPHPAVFDVAVIGRPDADLGQRVVAIIELAKNHSDTKQLSIELIELCQQRIAKFKCPRTIEYRVLPRTPTGKLLRRKLKEN